MKVLAALSGGVDSAVAAARAVDAGYEVVGVHMALSRSRAQHRNGARGWCSSGDGSASRRAAGGWCIPYYGGDLSEEFEETVVADFLSEYEAGRTPNACVRCNEHIKFSALLDRGLALGFDAVATGHYANIVRTDAGVELHRSQDSSKDQSYVLAVMGYERLQSSIFPLGDVASKSEVRAEAAARGLSISAKPDSYDICFVADGDTRGFLRERLGTKPGEIIDVDGNVLGSHEGSYGYTVGQRKGLGIERPAEDGKPRYVLATEPETNRVIVGPAALLSVDELTANEVVWLADDVDPAEAEDLAVQIRAHGREIPARVTVVDGEIIARLAEPVRGVATGQSLVVYQGSRVLGQGSISATDRVGENIAPMLPVLAT